MKAVVGRRAKKKAETARRIAIACRHLLRSKGFDAITTQEVAIAAGIPPGTLFGYITSKTDLLIIALVHEALEFVATIPPRVPAKAALLDKVLFVFNEMAIYHGRDFEVSKHFLRELAIPRNQEFLQQAASLGNAVRGVIIPILAEHQAAGNLTTELPAEKIGSYLFAHYWMALRYWFSGTLTKQEFGPTLKEALMWQISGLAAAERKESSKSARAPARKKKKTAAKG